VAVTLKRLLGYRRIFRSLRTAKASPHSIEVIGTIKKTIYLKLAPQQSEETRPREKLSKTATKL
jgi:hypothetical protein